MAIQGVGKWIAAYPEQERIKILHEEPGIAEQWDEKYGDRLTELVFIGVDMSEEKIIMGLNQCLLTDEETKQDWRKFHDPLPEFT
ncbi:MULTISPECIES: GTP-binding protein [Virgibacillus]|uniref:GTP-binding protein n=1 Tax=Virgibacillus TaxID=84406 RepID=UPI0009DC0B3F|nr:hypothetical protein [Virgibacillus massiliensis]